MKVVLSSEKNNFVNHILTNSLLYSKSELYYFLYVNLRMKPEASSHKFVIGVVRFGYKVEFSRKELIVPHRDRVITLERACE